MDPAPKPDDPLLAVVSPPRVARFRALLGVAPDETFAANFTGWSKLALLTRDLAVLFPRDDRNVEPLRLERDALLTVEPAGLAEVPRVVAFWEDEGISAYPVLAVTRLPGASLESVQQDVDVETLARILERVGRLSARWHDVAPGALAARPPRALPHRRGLDALLGTGPDAPSPSRFVADAADALALGAADRPRAVAAVARARALPRVVVHGDVHEAQLLVDPSDGFALTGVIDWQTALVDHPFTELDFGEWGPSVWRRHRTAFPALRRRYWDAYADARGLPADLGPVFEWACAAGHALHVRAGRDVDPAVAGTADEALARVRDATRALAP